MRNSTSIIGTTASVLLVCLTAGLTAGLVTSFVRVFALDPGGRAQQEPAPIPGLVPVPRAPDSQGLFEAIRALTEAVERPTLAVPERRAALPSDAGSSSALLERLAKTLDTIDETLERMEARSAVTGSRGAPRIDETLRIQPVRENQVIEMAKGLDGTEEESFKRTLYLRSVEEIVERFGLPNELRGLDGTILATWRTQEHLFQIRFIGGVVGGVN